MFFEIYAKWIDVDETIRQEKSGIRYENATNGPIKSKQEFIL